MSPHSRLDRRSDEIDHRGFGVAGATGGSGEKRFSFLVLVLALGGLIAMSARRRTHP